MSRSQGRKRHRLASLQAVVLLPLIGHLAAGIANAQAVDADSEPNILFLFADDVGRDAIGCYGGESYATPHLDQLARAGMRFDHAYSMAVCHPSRICLMTGQYPVRLGNPKWGSFPEEAEARSLGRVMQAAGYATAVAGKWQLCLMKNDLDQPARLGFDEWALFGWHEGPRYRDPMIYHNGEVMPDTQGKYGPDLYVEFLIDFMRRQVEAGKPFFAYYPMALAHDVTDDIGEPVPFYADGRWQSFGEMVEAMDDCVGRLVAALEELGVRDNTLVIYTTDNGSPKASYLSVGEDGKFTRPAVVSRFRGRDIRGGKGELTDWGTRVPLIVNWPGRVPEASTRDDLVDLADYLPTFAELAEAPLERLADGSTLDGTSFLNLLFDEEPKSYVDRLKLFAYAEHNGRQFVRTQDIKVYRDGRIYDLRDGADERTTKPSGEEDLDPDAQLIAAQLRAFFDIIPRVGGPVAEMPANDHDQKRNNEVGEQEAFKGGARLDLSLVHEDSNRIVGSAGESLADLVAAGEKNVPGWRAVRGEAGRDENRPDFYLVREAPDMSDVSLASAEALFDADGWIIVIEFEEAGRKRFAELSANLGRQVAIMVDDRVLSAPGFYSGRPIEGGVISISGSFDREAALELARSLAPIAEGDAGE